MSILDHEHQMIIEEDCARRLEMERRFAVPGCPWDCWDGWHEIAFYEFDPLDPIPMPPAIVLPHGLILIACECNSTRAGGVRYWPDWFKDG